MSEKKMVNQGSGKDFGEVPPKIIQKPVTRATTGEVPAQIIKPSRVVEKGEVPASLPAKPTQPQNQSGTGQGTGGSGSESSKGK